jgi:tetratricopeptide (TPR) repeat protein
MTKRALLIGVNEYGAGLEPLKAPHKDVHALAKVLKQPEIGGFDPRQVHELLDPSPQQLEGGIRDFFRASQKEDLVLLYFSGHGVVDASGSQLFLGTCTTALGSNQELYKTTAVSTKLIYEFIKICPCQQQIIILDCCHSGAFADHLTFSDDSALSIKQSLAKGGKRARVILASCTPYQVSYEKSDRDLSLYTHHLVAGLETGAADVDGDGQITIEELHYYVQAQLRSEAAMQPEMLSLQLEAAKFVIAQTTTTHQLTSEQLANQEKLAAYLRRHEDMNAARQIQLDLQIADRTAAQIYTRIGREQQQQSRLNRAIALYRESLKLYPHDVSTRQMLGDVLCWQNKWAEAQIYYQQIISDQPYDSALALAYYGLGNTENNQNRPAEAFAAYRQASHLDSNLPSVYIDWGIALYHQGKFEMAVEKLRMSLQIDEDNPRTYHFLNIFLFALGQNSAANAALDRALELWQDAVAADPCNSNAYGLFANALTQKAKFTEAEEAARKAIRLNPCNAEAHNALANILLNQKKIEVAIATYEEAISYNPCLVIIHANLGYALHVQGDLNGALEKYEYTLKVNPHLFHVYRLKGDALYNKGDSTGAITSYRQAIKINRHDFGSSYQLASVLRLSGNYAESITESQSAIVTCEQLLIDNPDDIAALFSLAQALQFQGQLAEATSIYLRIADMKDKPPFIYGSLGFAWSQQGAYPKAIKAFEAAIFQNPTDAIALYGLGEVFRYQKNFLLAISPYEQSIKLDPKSSQAYTSLGHVFNELNELGRAVGLYQQAIAINPHDAYNYHGMGIVLEKQGQLDSALEHMNYAVRLNTNEAVFYNDLANVYRKKGDLLSAINSYQTAISLQPTHPMFYSNLGCGLEHYGDLVSAAYELRMSVRLSRTDEFKPNLIRVLYRLAKESPQMSREQKIGILQEISFHDPSNAVWQNLIKTLMEGGDI